MYIPCARQPDRHGRSLDTPVGVARVDPFDAVGKPDARLVVQGQYGMGRIHVSPRYMDHESSADFKRMNDYRGYNL